MLTLVNIIKDVINRLLSSSDLKFSGSTSQIFFFKEALELEPTLYVYIYIVQCTIWMVIK